MMTENFPSLAAAKIISIDLETRDDDLKSSGPGVRRGAYIIGVSVVTDDFKAYHPIAHEEGPNLNKEAVFRWLKIELGRKNQPKVGANLLYDLDFLAEQGVEVAGLWYDVQNAEPLLDENRQGGYNLNSLGKKYLGHGKLETELVEACQRRGLKGEVQKHLWQLPGDLVTPYAINDAEVTLDVFKQQKKLLEAEDLWELFLLETRLMPLLLYMRRHGVRINVKGLSLLIKEGEIKLKKAQQDLNLMAGFEVNVSAAASVAQAFKKFNLDFPLTEKTNAPSFTKLFLKTSEHPLSNLVLLCRKLDKFIGTFLRAQIKDYLINGRLHCLFNQLRSDEYGTVTGRFSSSHPNLQFIPARDEELGPKCRSLFLPEADHTWVRGDYSQTEFRIFAHYAMGKESEFLRQQYCENPRIDFHGWCAKELGVERRKAKDINLGLIYGMGKMKLIKTLGGKTGDAEQFLKAYYAKFPFVKTTLQAVSDKAQRTGYVHTILKRRRRFNTWAPVDFHLAKIITAKENKKEVLREVAEATEKAKAAGNILPRPGVIRANTHKAFNAIDQGSAADLMKKAMVDCWESGVFNVLHPHLTVHDEIDVSKPRDKSGDEALAEMKHLLEHAIEFRVPIIVDISEGKNWGETK